MAGMQKGIADPIGRAINTFAALKGMDQRKQLLDEQREERQYQRRRQEKLDAQADEQFELNKRTAQENADWNRLERRRQVQQWGEKDIAKAREQSDQILLEFSSQKKVEGKEEWDADDAQELLSRLEPVQHGLRRKLADLYDPQLVGQRLAATKNILRQLRTGEFDHDVLLENANIVFAPELDARGEKYGAKQVRFNRLLPSPQGDGFVAELNITKADGSTYLAPATMNGGTAEGGDHEVKNFRMEEVAPYLVGQLLTLQGAEAYLKARGKVQEKVRKVKVVGSDKVGRILVYEDNGEPVRTLHGPIAEGIGKGRGGKGKADLIRLKTGVQVTFDNLRQSYLAYLKSHETVDSRGFLSYGDSLLFEEWVNQQAADPVFHSAKSVVVDIESSEYDEALEMAEKWGREQSGWLTSDDTDFADYGGSREQAIAEKTLEYYWMLKGQNLPQKGNDHPAVQGLGGQQNRQSKIQSRSLEGILEFDEQLDIRLNQENPGHMKIAREILEEAKGDKTLARQIARQKGYSF